MTSLKNPGPKLFFSQFGGEQPIPPEFIAAMQRAEEIQPVPNDVGPELLSDTIIESSVTTNRTDERVRKTIKKAPGNIVLLKVNTNAEGQPVQITQTLFPTGSTPDQPSATKNVAVHDLGNGWSIQEVAVEGTYVAGVFTPGVFPKNLFARERPNLIPPKFRPVIPTVTTRVDTAGTAVDPVLTGTELSESQEQTTEFRVRTETATQDLPVTPITLNKGHDTDDFKQDVAVIETLLNDSDNIDAISATKSVKVEQLGDGFKVQTTRSSSVPDPAVFSAEVPDVLPEEFRVTIPVTETRHNSIGTAAPPTLASGELARTDQQVNSFVHRLLIKLRSRANYPVTLLQTLRDGVQARLHLKFTGLVTMTRTVAVGLQSAQQGFLTLTSKVRNLGDGTSLRETETIDAFTTLQDNIRDETTGIITDVNKTIVPGIGQPNYTPNPSDSQTYALDKDRSMREQFVANAASIAAVQFVFPGTTDVDIPPELTSVFGLANTQKGGGAAGENGTYALSARGSGGINLKAEAQGSSAAIIEIGYNVKQVWGRNVPCLHVLFYAAVATSRAALITRIGVLSSLAVTDWPKFVPQSVVIISRGGKQTGQLNVTAGAHDSITVDSGGNLIFAGSIRTFGQGISFDVGSTIKALRIPPTIHGNLTVTGDTVVLIANNTVAAAGTISNTANGGQGNQTVSIAVGAGADLSTTSIGATVGQATIPTSGYRLHQLHTEPFRPGYIKVHAVVVNFSDLN